MNKPKILQKGDTIGLISPSGPLAGLLPHRTQQAVKALENIGFKVVIGKNALKVKNYTAGTAKERAYDLNKMFADRRIKAIISFIGGFHSNQLLDYLDFKTIKNNPKIFVGFSDVSVLHLAFYTKANLITFYGPAGLTQFGEFFGIDEYTLKYFKKAVMSPRPIGKVESSKEWTDEFLDWFLKEDIKRPRVMKPNLGFMWLKEGSCRGVLLGGCITSLLHLRGTPYWPNFKDKVFFWEIPESSCDLAKGEPLSKIDSYLTDLKLTGIFNQIKGMIVGRPRGYTKEENKQLKDIILEQVQKYTFPVLYNVDIGHTDPIITIPIGVKVLLDSEYNIFEIIETGVIE